jgi:hypothetical protein
MKNVRKNVIIEQIKLNFEMKLKFFSENPNPDEEKN